MRRLLEITAGGGTGAEDLIVSLTSVLPAGGSSVSVAFSRLYERFTDKLFSWDSVLRTVEAENSSSSSREKPSTRRVLRYDTEEWPLFFGLCLSARLSCLLRRLNITSLDCGQHDKGIVVALTGCRDVRGGNEPDIQVYLPISVRRCPVFECCLREACIDSARMHGEYLGDKAVLSCTELYLHSHMSKPY